MPVATKLELPEISIVFGLTPAFSVGGIIHGIIYILKGYCLSVSKGLTVNRQKGEILSSTVKKAVAKRSNFYQVFRSNLTVSAAHLGLLVLKESFQHWYNYFPCSQIYSLYDVFPSFASKLTLQLTPIWKYFRFQTIND